MILKITISIILLLCLLKFKRVFAVADIFCNVIFEDLLNWLFIKKASSHKFGNQREWVSSVIGKNLKAGTLTKAGRIFNNILNFFEKDHAIKQIIY